MLMTKLGDCSVKQNVVPRDGSLRCNMGTCSGI